jgi:hypothetical protein
MHPDNVVIIFQPTPQPMSERQMSDPCFDKTPLDLTNDVVFGAIALSPVGTVDTGSEISVNELFEEFVITDARNVVSKYPGKRYSNYYLWGRRDEISGKSNA